MAPQALQLLRMTAQTEVQSNAVTFSAAISACEKGGEWERALHLVGTMLRSSVESSTIAFNATLSACEKGAEWEKALGSPSLV